MADFLTEEWFAMVLDSADALPKIDGASFNFDIEVNETPHGKVRAHGRIEEGQLVSLVPGKFKPVDGEQLDVSFIGKAKRLAPIVTGDVNPLVAYMRGELKVDGAYEAIVSDLAARADRTAFEAFRVAVAKGTDF